jgi:hypothetical protein
MRTLTFVVPVMLTIQLKPYKHSGSRKFGTEKTHWIHLFHWKSLYQVRTITVFRLRIFDLVCLWTMVYAFPFRPVPLCSIILLLPLFVDNIIISINWNCLVIFVIVSFIIDLLDLHFHIFGGRDRRDRLW